MDKRVAVVTGGNRGIGLEICRQLLRAGLEVVLTARDESKGKAAIATLADESFTARFHALDITADGSRNELAQWLIKNVGRCDVLINNAGIMIDAKGARLADSPLESFRTTLETNLLAPLALIQTLLPLMKKNRYGRIVNMSSGLGQLADMGSGTPAYRISKTALNAVTRIAAAETRGDNRLVNSMCPGWVKTDMGGPYATRTPAQGADTALWLATLPDDGPTGGFSRDRQPIAW